MRKKIFYFVLSCCICITPFAVQASNIPEAQTTVIEEESSSIESDSSKEEISTTEESTTTEESVSTEENTTEETILEEQSSIEKEETSTKTTSNSEVVRNKNKEKAKKKQNKESKKSKTKEVKKISNTVIDEEDSAEKDTDPKTVDPNIYEQSELITKENVDYIDDYIYFCQGDAAWNQNGYRIASAGCGPTSMAVVISNLTGKWVTPIETTIWGYEHGYYSSAGSVHKMIPEMASAYQLQCEGVGTDTESIRQALKDNKMVVALMGPGYFTRRGHFMVLLSIDDDDNVTIADVGSRRRTQYKYPLSSIIAQSKTADAGGPFWVIWQKEIEIKPAYHVKSFRLSKKTIEEITVRHTIFDSKGKVKKKNKEAVYETHVYSLGDKISYNGQIGIIEKLTMQAMILKTEDGTTIKTDKGSKNIPYYAVSMVEPAVTKEIEKKIFPYNLLLS